MTRKDYEQFAKLMRNRFYDTTDKTDWANFCHDLARLFKQDNDRFSDEKFYEACGFDEYYPDISWRESLGLVAQ